MRPHKVPGRLPQGQATPRALPLEQDGEVSGGSCNRFDSHVTSRLAARMHGRETSESWIMSGQDSLSELSMHLLTGF